MNIIIVKNYQELSKKVADIFMDQFKKKPNFVFGLATGSTPLGMYKEIILRCKVRKLNLEKVITFNLDEYYSLSAEHPQSYHYFMQENLFKHIDIKKENIYIPDGKADNVEEHCRWYEDQIKTHPIDLQILGIGANGHVGFNEPGSSKNSTTRLVDLDKQTIKDNAKKFKNKKEMPKQAITVGIKTIMAAKKIVLLAHGKNKAKAIKCALEKKPNNNCPASWLQKHPDVTVIMDKSAANLLINK